MRAGRDQRLCLRNAREVWVDAAEKKKVGINTLEKKTLGKKTRGRKKVVTPEEKWLRNDQAVRSRVKYRASNCHDCPHHFSQSVASRSKTRRKKKKNEAGLPQLLPTILQPFSGRQRPSIVVVLWGLRVSGAAAPM